MSFDYTSKKWQRLSREVQKRAGWRCEIETCGRTKLELSAIGQRLVTHHRMNAETFPQFAFDPMLLLVVCEECHARIHDRVYRAPQPAIKQQMDFWTEALQIDSDLRLFERSEKRRRKAAYASETRMYSDEHQRLITDDKTRALQEANEIAEQQREKWREVGVLEDGYSRSGTLNTGDESDAATATEPAHPRGRRPT